MSQQIKKEFEQILSTKAWWKRFLGSQFLDGFSSMIAQVVKRVQTASARRLQEGFLSLATKRYSILAAAEDRAYIGLKISPSKGKAKITNKSDRRITIPANAPLISKDLTDYLIKEAVDLAAGSSVSVEISQLWKETIRVEVTEYTSWLSVLLPRNITQQVHSIDVYVNGELWEKHYKFRNTTPDSRAYMEYYKATEQLGVRFGNGINGRVPEVGDIILINAWCTNGETTLLDGQQLQLVDNFESLNDSLGIITESTITGGAAGDDIEEIRNGALYTTAYDYQLAWDGDYLQFIKTNVGGLVWLSVWGEKEQEKLNGEMDLRFINKIFISAYSDVKDDETLQNEIRELFKGREGYNEDYVFSDRIDAPFLIHVNGSTHPNVKPEDVEKSVRELLSNKYGKNVKNKPHQILEKDFWSDINVISQSAGIVDFTVTVENLTKNTAINTYAYLDVDASLIKFGYQETRD